MWLMWGSALDVWRWEDVNLSIKLRWSRHVTCHSLPGVPSQSHGTNCCVLVGYTVWDFQRYPKKERDAYFLDLSTLFLDLYMFFGPNWIFFGARVTKNVGDFLVCFLDPVGIFFLRPACICAGPMFFFDSQINCFWARLLFFGPVHLLRGPCLHRVGVKLHCYRRSHWAGCFWTLAPSLLEPAHVFLDLAQGEGNLDTETRCMQEVVDAGEVPVLKHKNVRSGGEASGGSLRMKRNGCRKLMGT